uniref:F-box domain-containing protein n=2 Tax=Steinernema glaseri TaxID=37863 RepID=A0A1I7ZAG2_9BILA
MEADKCAFFAGATSMVSSVNSSEIVKGKLDVECDMLYSRPAYAKNMSVAPLEGSPPIFIDSLRLPMNSCWLGCGGRMNGLSPAVASASSLVVRDEASDFVSGGELSDHSYDSAGYSDDADTSCSCAESSMPMDEEVFACNVEVVGAHSPFHHLNQQRSRRYNCSSRCRERSGEKSRHVQKRKSSAQQEDVSLKRPALSMAIYIPSASTSKWIDDFRMMPDSVQIEALSGLIEACSMKHVRHIQGKIQPYFQKDFISLLPRETALKILQMLAPEDLIRASLTSRQWHELTEDDMLWKKKCKQYGVRELPPPALRHSEAWLKHPKRSSTTGVEIQRRGVDMPEDMEPHTFQRQPTPDGDVTPRSDITEGGSESNRDFDEDFLDSTMVQDDDEDINIDGPFEPLVRRCWWKAVYLRQARIIATWRGRDIRGYCPLKGHDEHVITCLQIHGDHIITGSDDNTLKVWSASQAKCLHTLTGHIGGVWSSQISSDGKILISGSTDRTVKVWCMETGRLLHSLVGHTSTVRCMALNGRTLVSGSRDATLRIWNIDTGVCLNTLTGHVAAVRCVQFDGRRVISGAYDYTIKVWDVATAQSIHTLTGHTNRVYSLLFDSPRNIVVSGSLDTTIKIWNIQLGVCMHTLTGHQSLTSEMQLRNDILVSGNADSTIKVWNIKDGRCIYTLTGEKRHMSAVTSLQFMENGMVASSSDDGTVKLWDIEHGQYVRDLVNLESGGHGGCIWRVKATPTMLACAVGSRTGIEDTKLVLLDFDAAYP